MNIHNSIAGLQHCGSSGRARFKKAKQNYFWEIDALKQQSKQQREYK